MRAHPPTPAKGGGAAKQRRATELALPKWSDANGTIHTEVERLLVDNHLGRSKRSPQGHAKASPTRPHPARCPR